MAEANGCCPERGHRTGARWFHRGGRGCRRAAKRGRARLLPSRETWEGEAPAEPPNVGGRGSCRAAKRGRARLLPSRQTWEGEAPAEPWEPAARQQFGSAGASPSRRGGQTGVSAQQELRPPEGAARRVFRLSGSFALPKGRHPWQANLQLRTGFCVDPKMAGKIPAINLAYHKLS